MPTRDPDWFTPHTDDYADTYTSPRPTGPDDDDDDDDGDTTTAQEYAEQDTMIRFTIERGRPGFALDDDNN